MLIHRLKVSGLLSFGPAGRRFALGAAERPHRPERIGKVQLPGGSCTPANRTAQHYGSDLTSRRISGVLVERSQCAVIHPQWKPPSAIRPPAS